MILSISRARSAVRKVERTPKIHLMEQSISEINTGQWCALERNLAKVGFAKSGIREVGAAKGTFVQNAVIETCSCQAAIAKVHMAQHRTIQNWRDQGSKWQDRSSSRESDTHERSRHPTKPCGPETPQYCFA